MNLAEFEEELAKTLDKKIDVIMEETYTEEIMCENKYENLAGEIFYKEVKKDRRILYD